MIGKQIVLAAVAIIAMDLNAAEAVALAFAAFIWWRWVQEDVLGRRRSPRPR